MELILKTLSIVVFLLALSGCSSIPTGSRDNWIGYAESGKASFYADEFQNRKTSSGERYNHSLKTAAH